MRSKLSVKMLTLLLTNHTVSTTASSHSDRDPFISFSRSDKTVCLESEVRPAECRISAISAPEFRRSEASLRPSLDWYCDAPSAEIEPYRPEPAVSILA